MRLAWLALRRTRRRSALLVTIVTLLTSLVMFLSTVSTTLVGSLAGAVATSPADVLVLSSAAQGNLQASRISPEQAAAVEQVAGVAEVAPVGETRVTVRVDGRELPASLWGVDPDSPAAPPPRASGRAPERPAEALADAADATRGLVPGATVTIDHLDLEVVGSTEGARFGGIATLYVPYQTWLQILEALHPHAAEIRPNALAVRVGAGVDAAALAARIDAKVDGVAARVPADAADALPGIVDIRLSLGAISVMGVAAALLVTGFAWTIAVAQQRGTLATLLAIGVTVRRLLRSVVLQAAAVAVAGVALAAALVLLLASRAPPTFPLRPQPTLLAAIGAAVVAGSLLATTPAVRRIARLEPVLALATGPTTVAVTSATERPVSKEQV